VDFLCLDLPEQITVLAQNHRQPVSSLRKPLQAFQFRRSDQDSHGPVPPPDQEPFSGLCT
jgi:hypothetical protein